MNNAYLEKLMKKPTPQTENIGLIVFANKVDTEAKDDKAIKEAKDDNDDKEENNDDKEENNDDKEENNDDKEENNDDKDIDKPMLFQIIDKRKNNNIDRSLILERLTNRQYMNEDIVLDQIDVVIQDTPTGVSKPRKLKKKITIIGEQRTDILNEENAEPLPIKKIKIKVIKPKTVSTALLNNFKIGDTGTNSRLPIKKDKIIQKSSTYYMNNRKISIDKLNKLFQPYKQEILDNTSVMSCDSKDVDFGLLTHQKIVRDYLNLYTPYRGLLLYHGLGSGKTCSSIAIAEGMKSDKKIVLMTPASLKMNFFSELKKCGDELFRKNQFWEFISTTGKEDYKEAISSSMGISKEFIEKYNGAWMVNIKKPSNYKDLTANEQATLDEQLNEMIRHKYNDINYNGLNMNILNELTNNQTTNPFNNKVIIIDEAHNFVSRIVNKLDKPGTISYVLYDLLMRAENAKIVLLTGTPIINYPNEIGILYNILRGYIKTWKIPVVVKSSKKINRDSILEMFQEANLNTHDFLEYSGNTITITRNPFGFINVEKRNYTRKVDTQKKRYGGELNATKKHKVIIKGGTDGPFDRYNGVKLDESGNINDETFIRIVTQILKTNEIEPQMNMIKLELNKSLPDVKDEFIDMFIDADTATLKDSNLFKRRILGLSSYFRSAQESLLPEFVLNEAGENYHLVMSEMSDHQFSIYEKIRKTEANQEKNKRNQSKKKKPNGELYEIASSYRIFSRAACNFTFPDPPGRPMPDNETISELDVDGTAKELIQDADVYSNQDDPEPEVNADYVQRVQTALKFLSDKPSEYLVPEALEQFSPKFFNILSNLTNDDHEGLHLLYSQFRTIEGIGLLKLVLEANGFSQFKIKKKSEGEWTIDMPINKKPKFMLYTGTETAEEKEILRNVYNSQWEFIPNGLRNELEQINKNNFMGEIVKIIMITSSGAEGINLKNTRYVHIVEPYWNMVRLDQVVGRARRICSHHDLPEKLRTVQVFLYISTLSEKQSNDDNNKELIIRDVSKLDQKTPITTDESLYEISRIKNNINQQLLKAVKESSIDCAIYKKNASDNLVCYGYGKVNSNQFGSYPSLEVDKYQKDDINVKKQTLQLRKITIQGKDYAYDQKNNIVYDMESYKESKKTGETLRELGRLGKQGRNNVLVKI
jgi:hypothetical protein